MHTSYDNKIFYEKSSENYIYDMLQSAGLQTSPDIPIVLKYINKKQPGRVVDLGAGEGRVIKALLNYSFFDKIVGVEYTEIRYQILKEMFAHLDQVSILHENILNINGEYDYGLLLFSTLIDFTKDEQSELLYRLSLIIRKKIFIDLPKFNAQKNGFYLPNQHAVIEMPWGRLEGFFPKKDDLLSFFEGTGFYLEAIEAYKTDTNRERELFIFSKQAFLP